MSQFLIWSLIFCWLLKQDLSFCDLKIVIEWDKSLSWSPHGGFLVAISLLTHHTDFQCCHWYVCSRDDPESMTWITTVLWGETLGHFSEPQIVWNAGEEKVQIRTLWSLVYKMKDSPAYLLFLAAPWGLYSPNISKSQLSFGDLLGWMC